MKTAGLKSWEAFPVGLVACAVVWGIGPGGGTPQVAAMGPPLVVLESLIESVHADQPCGFSRYAPARVGCFLIEWIEGKVGLRPAQSWSNGNGREKISLGT